MTTQTKSRGFTIVELLIVIVVIAILAAITIVAYTGITKNANNSAAKSNADALRSFVSAYQADDAKTGVFPTDPATETTQYAKLPAGVTINGSTATATLPTATNGKNTLAYKLKSGGTGACIGYFDFNGNAPAYMYVGDATTQTITSGAIATCS